MNIYCCQCERIQDAVLTDGTVIYPHRLELADCDYWQCPQCKNYVGTHKNRMPLGTIPTPELRNVRRTLHHLLDPLWENKRNRVSRKFIYQQLSHAFGKAFHIGEINSVEEGKKAALQIQLLKRKLIGK